MFLQSNLFSNNKKRKVINEEIFEKVKRLKAGKERKQKILMEMQKYRVDLPTSILKAKEFRGLYKSQKSWMTEIMEQRLKRKGIEDEELIEFLLSSTSGISTRQNPLGTTRFPLNVARTLYWLYTEEGDLIADPFAGHGDRMEAAIQMNRRYVGWDISKNMIQEINQRLSEYPEEKRKLVKIVHGDSRLFELDEECDYVLTSPPYWCLTPDTLIVTRDGLKPISEIKEGEYVLTHKGRFRKVTKVMKRLISEPILEIRVYGCNVPLRITKEHKVFAIRLDFKSNHKPKFIPAEDLRIGDLICLPNELITHPITEIKETNYTGWVYNLEVEEDNSYTTICGTVHNCIEYYGDEPEQLGNCETYERFLLELKRIFKRVVNYLKPGKFITINVNDFRYMGKFYLYHVDVINILQDLGLEIYDIGVIQLSELPITHPFVAQYKERKYLMKMHEYLITARKPK